MMLPSFDRDYETDLLNRLKSGEQAAWSEFVKYYGTKLHRYLTPHLPDLDSVDDLLSEILLASVKAIQSIEAEASLTTLIYAIANRKLADFWRQKKSTQALELGDLPVPSFFDETFKDQLEFSEILAQLGEVESHALFLRYQVGLSVSEIAEIMHRSYRGTESLLSRARQHLKEIITQQEIASSTSLTNLLTLLNTIVQMLDTQIKRCLAYGMVHEAMLFAQSAQLLIDLTGQTIGANDLDRRHKKTEL